MQTAFQYRSYSIDNEDGRYSAKSMDGEPCNLHSRYLMRVLRAVDTLWTSVELATVPVWFADWMKSPAQAIDLDAGADAKDDFAVLAFPKTPTLSLVRGAAAVASAAAIMLMVKANNAMAIMQPFAA